MSITFISAWLLLLAGHGAVPSNDECANATSIFFGSTNFDTTEATDSNAPIDNSLCPDTYLGTVSQDVWFRLTAIESGVAIISTCDSVNFDTDLIAYADSCGTLQQIACNGDFDGCAGYSSRMTFNVTIGQSYLVRLGGWNSGEFGIGTINVGYGSSGSGACCFGGTCLDGYSLNQCAQDGGEYQGNDSTCSADTCDEPVGACCFVDWCDDGITESDCYDNFGKYQGDGSDCSSVTCDPGDYGACCIAFECYDGTSEEDCSSSGGAFYLDDTCQFDTCDNVGTCCVEYDCYEQSLENDCYTLGGDFYFGDTPCDGSSLCGEPISGACCYPDGYCDETQEQECYDGNGKFYEDQDCNDVCNVSYGACCTSDFGDCQSLTEQQCDQLGGDYLGDDYPCSFDDCYIEPYGACCISASDCQDTTQQECFDWGGEWGGSGTYCADYSCGETGACCINKYDCYEEYEDECSWQGGSFQGEGSTCDEYPCGSPYGACCLDGSCYETEEHLCYADGGKFQGQFTFCDDSTCSITGACCLPDGSCQDYEETICLKLDGTYQGDYVGCNAVDCSSGPVFENMTYVPVGTDLVTGVGPNWTVDLYVTAPENWRVDAVAGNSANEKTLTASEGFYQNSNGGPLSTDVNPSFYEFDSNLEWDSRVTIGSLDSSGDPWSENSLSSVGIDWSDFESGTGLSVDNGTWYVLPTADQGNAVPITTYDCQEIHGVLVGRITALGTESVVNMSALVVVREGDDPGQQILASASDIPRTEVRDCNENGVADVCDIANGASLDSDGNGIPDECENSCVGDFNQDGQTNIDDILHVIGGWGDPYDVEDLLSVLDNYGCTG